MSETEMQSTTVARQGHTDGSRDIRSQDDWSNWHTWNLYRWIISDEQAHSEACLFAREGPKAFTDWCHDFIWVGMGFELDPPASAGTDFVLSGLNEVDYSEIRQRLLDSREGPDR
jgi:hypothetical protein